MNKTTVSGFTLLIKLWNSVEVLDRGRPLLDKCGNKTEGLRSLLGTGEWKLLWGFIKLSITKSKQKKHYFIYNLRSYRHVSSFLHTCQDGNVSKWRKEWQVLSKSKLMAVEQMFFFLWLNYFTQKSISYCNLTKSVFYSLFCLHRFGFAHSLLWPQITVCCPQQRTIQSNSSSPSSVSLPVDSTVPWVTAASLGAIQCVNSLWEVDGRDSWWETSSSSDPSISLPHTFLSLI